MKKHLLIQRGFACDPTTGFWFNSFTRKGINEAAIRKAPIEDIKSWVHTAIPQSNLSSSSPSVSTRSSANPIHLAIIGRFPCSPDRIPCYCDKIPCSAKIIPCSVE